LHAAPNTGTAWDAQIQLTLPTYIGGGNQAKIDEANALQRQAENALGLLSRRIGKTIEDTYRTLRSELTQIKILENALELSARNVKIVSDDYRMGMSTNLDVLQALNALVDNQRTLNKLRYAYRTDYARLSVLSADVPQEGSL
jgi:outer membrane protein